MSKKDKAMSRRRLDQALKTAFDNKAAERVPDRLIDLVDSLEAPASKLTKVG